MTLVCSMQVSAQKINPVIGFSQSVSFLDGPFLGTSLSVGARFNMGVGFFEVKAGYMLLNDKYKSFSSHQLGGSITYRILSSERRCSPYIELNAFTEVGSNYRNGLLRMDTNEPQSYPESYVYANSHGGPWHTEYYSKFYHSTPLVFNALAGVDFRLTDGLHLNIGCGFGYRGMSTRSRSWEGSANLPTEEIERSSIGITWYNLVDVKLGLTYAFSVKKTPK